MSNRIDEMVDAILEDVLSEEDVYKGSEQRITQKNIMPYLDEIYDFIAKQKGDFLEVAKQIEKQYVKSKKYFLTVPLKRFAALLSNIASNPATKDAVHDKGVSAVHKKIEQLVNYAVKENKKSNIHIEPDAAKKLSKCLIECFNKVNDRIAKKS